MRIDLHGSDRPVLHMHDAVRHWRNGGIVRDDDESARKLYAMGPAVYVGMSTKDVYNVLNAIKKYQSKKENL